MTEIIEAMARAIHSVDRQPITFDAVRAALAEAERMGWKLVPVGDTKEMRTAGAGAVEFWVGGGLYDELVNGDPENWPGVNPGMTDAWHAMLSASPKP